MSLNGDGIPMNMPVVPAGSNGGGGWGGFGDGNGWWLILFLIIICGWGGYGNGFGNRGGSTGGVMDGYVLTSDFASVERKLDSIANGICDSTFALNNSINGVNQNMNTGFSNAELSRCNQQAALMQQLNNMAMQSANCCCETREAIQGVNYNLATQACDTRNQVQNSTRDIIDAMNCGFRSIDQRLTAQELAAKDAKIAEQNQQIFGYQLAASQAAQNNYLVSTLRPSPNPAYVVANPYCCNSYNSGYNYGCGNCA